eukprot:Hpha_TRINITY_DN7808_c0_g1::TRINITY_DN7808_c0_g1_i1::g.185542::m.185542
MGCGTSSLRRKKEAFSPLIVPAPTEPDPTDDDDSTGSLQSEEESPRHEELAVEDSKPVSPGYRLVSPKKEEEPQLQLPNIPRSSQDNTGEDKNVKIPRLPERSIDSSRGRQKRGSNASKPPVSPAPIPTPPDAPAEEDLFKSYPPRGSVSIGQDVENSRLSASSVSKGQKAMDASGSQTGSGLRSAFAGGSSTRSRSTRSQASSPRSRSSLRSHESLRSPRVEKPSETVQDGGDKGSVSKAVSPLKKYQRRLTQSSKGSSVRSNPLRRDSSSGSLSGRSDVSGDARRVTFIGGGKRKMEQSGSATSIGSGSGFDVFPESKSENRAGSRTSSIRSNTSLEHRMMMGQTKADVLKERLSIASAASGGAGGGVNTHLFSYSAQNVLGATPGHSASSGRLKF